MKALTSTSLPRRMAAEPNDASHLNGMLMLLEAIACIDNSITNILPNESLVHVLPKDIAVGKKNNDYNYTSVHGYELCNACGKKVALTKDGTLRRHRCCIHKKKSI